VLEKQRDSQWLNGRAASMSVGVDMAMATVGGLRCAAQLCVEPQAQFALSHLRMGDSNR
jgi:hypothetical protein